MGTAEELLKRTPSLTLAQMRLQANPPVRRLGSVKAHTQRRMCQPVAFPSWPSLPLFLQVPSARRNWGRRRGECSLRCVSQLRPRVEKQGCEARKHGFLLCEEESCGAKGYPCCASFFRQISEM